MHAALFYLPGERLSGAELCAARIDGHVAELGEGFIAADTPETASQRALSLSTLTYPTVAISGPSAAWVHGAGDTPPRIHHFQRYTPLRGRYPSSARAVFHDTLLPEGSVVLLAGIAVVTPLVAMMQLARFALRDEACELWVHHLHQVDHSLSVQACRTLESGPRFPGRAHALELLKRLE